MKRILIIGSGGSGKSTLAIKLGEITNLSVYHLDKYHWKPNWLPSEKEKWEQTVKDLVSNDSWIIDGNYISTLDIRLRRADKIIFLHFSRLTCLLGIFKRHILKNRVDAIEGCNERFDLDFYKWVWNFNKNNAPTILKKLSKAKGKSIHIIKSRKELGKLVQSISDQRGVQQRP